LEVAQIARAIARSLGLDEDLAEALALAHDLGHPPFGHAGEEALALCLASAGGFDHNAQTVKIVTKLERRYAEYDGLNLTFETLEGLVKHNGPLTTPDGTAVLRYADGIPQPLAHCPAVMPIPLHGFASAEAQAAALADDIAYNAHDIDDGVRAGVLSLQQLQDVPLLRPLLREVDQRYPHLEDARRLAEVVRRLLTVSVEDVIFTSTQRLRQAHPASLEEVRAAEHPMVAFSNSMAQNVADLKMFLLENLYQHPRVMPIWTQAHTVVTALFEHFCAHPESLPEDWRNKATPRRIGDYIAGMTDTYALKRFEALKN
jgi:dGTPase